MISPELDQGQYWPALPLAAWQDTYETLHMYTQIVGKVRLALTPRINHWWNVPLYVSSRGLTTSMIPYRGSAFELLFDLIEHQLVLRLASGQVYSLPLLARPVSEFYREFMAMLRLAGIEVSIWTMPVEIPDPVPFEKDHAHASYDREAVQRFWRVLLSSAAVLEEFRSGFLGKSSPVHFFWGSFDLAVTRFSGRPAPERPGADFMTREAYSHEVSSVGFWPGAGLGEPAFYSYAAPEPQGFSGFHVQPAAAHYDPALKEFILAYQAVREAAAPSGALLQFCESTYAAAASLGQWDRDALERKSPAKTPAQIRA